MIDGQMGNQPLNGNDARSILGIVFAWIESAPLEADPEDLRAKLLEYGYGKPIEAVVQVSIFGD